MSEIITSRRSFLTGLGAALITAPAIVRAGSLMPVKAWMDGDFIPLKPGDRLPYLASPMDISEVVRRSFKPLTYAQMYRTDDFRKMLEFSVYDDDND